MSRGLPPLQAKNQPDLVSRTSDGINWLWEKGLNLFGAPSSSARLEDARYHRRAVDGLLGPAPTIDHGSITVNYVPDPCKLEVWDRHQLSDLFQVIGKPFTRDLDTLSVYGLGQCLKLNCVGFNPVSARDLGTIPTVSFHAPGGSVEYTMMVFFDSNTTALMSERELAALQSENCDHDGLLENVRIVANLTAADLKPGTMLMLTDGEFADVLASVPHCELAAQPGFCATRDEDLSLLAPVGNATERELTVAEMLRLQVQAAAYAEEVRRLFASYNAAPPAGPVSQPSIPPWPPSNDPFLTLILQGRAVDSRLRELVQTRRQLQASINANLSTAGNSTAQLIDIDEKIALLTQERKSITARIDALLAAEQTGIPQPDTTSPARQESPEELLARVEAILNAFNNGSLTGRGNRVPLPTAPMSTGMTTTSTGSSTGSSTATGSTTGSTSADPGTGQATSTGSSSGNPAPGSTTTASSAFMPAPADSPEPTVVSADEQPVPLDGLKLGGLVAAVVAANVVVGYAVYKTRPRVAT